jgi:hypothetical protein
MVTLRLSKQNITIETDLLQLAEIWSLELQTISENQEYLLLPDYILRKHGIVCEEIDGFWQFRRGHDATTWEDFLLMHIAHHLAAKHDSLLQYGASMDTVIEPTPVSFNTFEHYANYVTRKEAGIMKEIKVKWLYTHQKRHLR